MRGLGATGAQQSNDCAFEAGELSGAPLRVSWYLVIMFVYQLFDALGRHGVPLWFRIAQVTGNEALLLLTVLCHEMGHGTMARKLGGEIKQVLLWPFGGICFTTRAGNRTSHQKLVDDLWIVGAGPATHFPMAGAWLVLLFGVRFAWGLDTSWEAMWHSRNQCYSPVHSHCINSLVSLLLHGFLVQAIMLNVVLFLFNVFFPMYPMDGAKLIVCSLQLFCGASARCAANVLIFTSGPLAVLFIAHSLWSLKNGGGSMMPGIAAYMGIMCLSETWKIYKLRQEQRLHAHPLFETARSDARDVIDASGVTRRLNDSDHDDENPRGGASRSAPKDSGVQFTDLKPFSGAGQTLGASPSGPSGPTSASRSAWLSRIEADTATRGKSVRQLEEEQAERARLA